MNITASLKDEAMDQMTANWPDCAAEGCQELCCLALDSIHCFEHTPGNEHVKRMKIDAASVDPLADSIYR